MAENTNFHLKVQSRQGMVFEGEVTSISSFNDEGEFDVLAEHANFISLINKGLAIVDVKGEEKEINFDNALLRVKGLLVEVYIGVSGLSPARLPTTDDIPQTK